MEQRDANEHPRPANDSCADLALLFADRKLGAASKLAFLQLWRFAGCQPAQVTITADWLAGRCGRSPKAAWLWIEELQNHDLIAVGERNERRGTITITVFNPCPGRRAAITDAQLRMDFTPAPEPPSAAAEPVAEVLEPKPPRPLVPKKNSTSISYQSTNVSKASKPKEASKSNALPKRADFLAIAAAAMPAPAEQKEALKRRIVAACAPERVADWVAGQAANLVLYHEVPMRELDQILADVDAMARTGKEFHPAAFFHSKARQLAWRHGAPWPHRRATEVPS